ncbi:LysR family transcriptional regulator [Pseudonocardia sp. NPDC049154]|uniref:LysR family transcriptional regulator n=1 Tax=Pseudonocardia sp. NPDC049154 TaxID=3155501 RepID=UPI0033F28AA5
MDLRRLEAFVVLARELNFTRAARHLHVTQSTLSAAMKSLESELGATLFARSTRSVALSDAGRALLPHARATIDAMDAARSAVSATGELRGSLTVGMLSGLTVVDVPALVGRFHQRHPQVRLRLETPRRGTADLVDEVVQGRVDVAFVGGRLVDPRLRAVPIRTYDLQVAVPADHPYAAKSSLTLDELANEAFVDMPDGYGQRTIIDVAFAYRALPRTVVAEVTDLRSIPGYVAHRLGIALLPPEVVRDGGYPLRTIPVSDTDLSWTLSVVTHAEHPSSRSLKAFLDLVPAHVRPERAF